MPTPDEAPSDIEVAPPFRYARVYTGADGETHFSDHEMPFNLMDFAPPAPPISVTESLPAQAMAVISSPGGWAGDWHPTPRRQFIIVLPGELEVEVSDGEVRRFGPASIVLVEDIHGKGHISRVSSEMRSYSIALPLQNCRRGG